MAPYTGVPLSPAELSYIHTSLSQNPPIRPDGRSPTQFLPLIAETNILPSTNGSARICFADGTEAIVGIKAEVEKTRVVHAATGEAEQGGVRGLGAGEGDGDVEMDAGGDRDANVPGHGRDDWLELAMEIPGTRDDDALPAFLGAMLTEALLADGTLRDRLWINRRFHWRLYVDILILSPPLSYPLPLMSLTTHLALLSTRIPALVSEKDEDPIFNDDWEASTYLFPRATLPGATASKPPITLLVMSVGQNIIFDPSKDELAVADAAVAISVVPAADGLLRPVALRSIDPPSRLTAAGVPNAANATESSNTGTMNLSHVEALALREKDQGQTVWRPPRGGLGRTTLTQMIKAVIEKGGVGQEVLDGLANIET